jgi:antitoxin component of RelBE/YafQ-DinJ toxin-antitoxin module
MDTKDDRVHLRINSTLKREVQAYCARRGIEMSDLVTRFFVRVVHNDKERLKPKTQ